MKTTTNLCLFILFNLYATDVMARQFQADLDFSLGVPQYEFSDQLERLGVGLNFSGGYQFRQTPFMVGADLGFQNFGVESREEPLSTTIPDLRVLVENSYNLATGNLFIRVLAPDKTVRPYIDGLLGFNYFYTETVIRERGFASDDPILRDTNFEDVALNYGFGGGVKIKVYSGVNNHTGESMYNVRSAYISLSTRYLFGREAEYLKEGSITRENGEVFFDVQKSKTDLLYFKMGFGLVF